MSIFKEKQDEFEFNYSFHGLYVFVEQIYYKSHYSRIITIYRFGPKGGLKTVGKHRVNLEKKNMTVREQFSELKKKIRSKIKANVS